MLLLFNLPLLSAQDYQNWLYFNHLTNNDGLSSNKVNCIYEDAGGYIWFGTEDGLDLYDGVGIKVFKQDPDDSSSICNSSVYSLASDPSDGNLWIGTRKGVCYFDKETYKFHQSFDATDFSDISDHIIFDLKFDRENRLWIGTSYGLFCFDKKNNILRRFLHSDDDSTSIVSNSINNIFIDTTNRIFLSTRLGLDLFNPGNGSFIHLFQGDSLKNVMQVYQDSRNDYWICTDNMGLYKASFGSNPSVNRFFYEKGLISNTYRIHTVLEDDKNNLLLVARDKGLFYYDRNSGKLSFYEPDIFDSKSLNSKALISAFKSSSGIIWIGTYNKGVNYIDYNRKPFKHYKINYKETGLINNNIRSFYQDSQGAIWLGTKEGGGLSRFHPKKGTFDNYVADPEDQHSISSDYILAINELDDHTLILGTLGEGIDLFNKRTHEFTNIRVGTTGMSTLSDNKIYSLFMDDSGNIFVASLNRLFRFNRKARKFSEVDGVQSVKCMQEAGGGGIWMGTKFNGLLHYHQNERKWYTHSEDSTSISSNDITSIRYDNDHTLWVGTSNGLNALDLRTNTFRSWHESDGLPGNRICALEIDDKGNVWASTTNGLSKFNVQTGIFRNYFIGDGLQGNEFETYVSLKSTDGNLYFGGSNGFNYFDPEAIKDNLLIPEIHFTDFKIANKSVVINGKNSPLKKHIDKTRNILLKHTQSDFTFEFVALNYTSPQKNMYKYKLEGYDNDWVSAGTNRFATYTNIGHGDYVFKVIASNNDNIWNNNPRTVKLTILPPPWKTGWAYAIYIFIISMLVFGLYYFINKRIEQQNLLLFERKEREKLEQINQLKLRFFTNISHEFRTPLTLISSPLAKLINQQEIAPSEQRYLYLTMHKNVKRLLRLIKQLMDFRKLENQQLRLRVKKGELSGFIQDMIHGFEEFAENKKIKIFFEAKDENCPDQWFDHNIIDGVIFNLLSNAIKFSSENSVIKVLLQINDNIASIKVIDNGIGIPADKIEEVFNRFYSENYGMDEMAGTGIGLSFSQSLIALHKGEITVQSEPGVETIFTVKIPVSKQAYSNTDLLVSTEEHQVIEEKGVSESIPRTSNELYETVKKERKNISLLIVEDNVELRKFLVNHFSEYRVLEAGDGVEALAKARQSIPDIILSDVMMPRMDGVQLCNEIKSDVITSHIPVILLTAKTAIEHKIEGYEHGADAYIEKPFDINLVDSLLRNLLKQRELLRKRFTTRENIHISEIGTGKCDQDFFEKAEKLVGDNIHNLNFSVEDFSALLNMSRSQLFRKFKAVLDITPSEFIRLERVKAAKKLLDEGRYNVNEISIETGFSSPSHFISTFKKATGFTPREYQQR